MKKKLCCLLLAPVGVLAVLFFLGNINQPLGKGLPAPAAEITVSAAASLKDVLEEIISQYRLKRNVRVNLNLGSSGSLMHQIRQGAPVDAFIAASPQEIAELQRDGILINETCRSLVKNQLVLITHPDKTDLIKDLTDLTRIKFIAVGDPATVPAGRYTREALINIGLWGNLQPKLIFTKDVRQVLALVETANVDAGFVYLTDTAVFPGVKVVSEITAGYTSPITYMGAVLSSSAHRQVAEDFLNYLTGSETAEIFRKYKFIPLKP